MSDNVVRNAARLSREEAATRLGKSVSWLDKQRAQGKGPRYRAVGRSIEYTDQWISDYLRIRERDTDDTRRAA